MEVSPKPLRILYVITLGWWGGAQRYVFDMATAAKAMGHEVWVITGEGELPVRLREAGIEVYATQNLQRGLSLGAEVRSFRDLMQFIREVKPDVVHTNSSKGGLFGAIAARLCHVPQVVFTAHGWAFTEHRAAWQKLLFWMGHYATVLLSDATLCVSHAIRRAARRMPFVQRRLRVVHNGVPDISFLSREDARKKLAPHLPLPFWIGTIAELHPNKRLDVLIEAFARVHRSFPEAALVIMGEGSERAALEARIHALGLESSIRLCGHVPNARTYLRALDLFVLPSHTEALGYVLLEAGQAGLPVVASRVGGIPEIVESGRTGFLVPRGEVERFAGAMIELANDANLRHRLGSALEQKVREEFSVEQMLEKTLATYAPSYS